MEKMLGTNTTEKVGGHCCTLCIIEIYLSKVHTIHNLTTEVIRILISILLEKCIHYYYHYCVSFPLLHYLLEINK